MRPVLPTATGRRQKTVVPTVTRPGAAPGDDDTVTSTGQVRVSIDLAGNAEHVEGTVLL